MYAFCITEHINMSGCSSAGQLVSLSLAITDHQALGFKLALLVHVSLSSIMNNKFMFLDKSLKWLMETWIMWRHSTNTSLLYFSRCFICTSLEYLIDIPPYIWTQMFELSPPHILKTICTPQGFLHGTAEKTIQGWATSLMAINASNNKNVETFFPWSPPRPLHSWRSLILSLQLYVTL